MTSMRPERNFSRKDMWKFREAPQPKQHRSFPVLTYDPYQPFFKQCFYGSMHFLKLHNNDSWCTVYLVMETLKHPATVVQISRFGYFETYN